MVRRQPLVGGSDRGGRPARGRAAAHLPSPGELPGTVAGTQGPARRALHGARGGRRLARVTGGRGSLGPRTHSGRWAADSEPGSRSGASSTRTCARRTRSVGCPRPTAACCPLRSWLRSSRSRSRVRGRHASPTRWSAASWRPRSRSRFFSRSQGRRSWDLHAAVIPSTRTGSCLRPFPSASSPAPSRWSRSSRSDS